MPLDIKDLLTGDTRQIVDFNGLNRERGVNGEKLISLNIFDTEKNTKSFPLALEENVISFDGEEYVIKEVGKKSIGQTYYKELVCIHKFFCDMREQRIYESYTQSFTFIHILNTIFDGTGYTYEVIGTFYAEQFEKFGDGKDKLELFNDILSRYSAEFEILDNVIRLSKKKGLRTPTFKLLYNHNIKTIDYSQNTNNLSTYIKGYGDLSEDNETYRLITSYTSPNAAKFPANTPDGLRHAPPIKDGKYTSEASLQQALQEALIDVPEVSITLSFADMRKYGYPHAVPNDGDDIYLIHEPFDLDLTVRIVKIVEHFNKNLEPIDCDVTLGNPRENITDQFNSTEKKLGQILDPNGRINQSYLPAQTERLTKALLSVETELTFDNGIMAIDKNNPNNIVLLNSMGLGISNDGGATFKEAITSDGFVLTAGVIGSLTFDNALGRFLYIDNGAISIKRKDGVEWVQDGMMRNDFSVFEHYPPFKNDNDHTIVDYWFRTPRDYYVPMQYYSIHHNSQYVKILVGLKGTSGNHAYFQFIEEGGSGASIETYEWQYEQGSGYFKTLTLDLGKPTYTRRYFQARLKTLDPTRYAFGRILRIWTEG